MTFQKISITVLGFLATLMMLMTHQGVLGQQQNQLGPCSKGLEEELPQQCLAANGIDHQGTLFVISGNRTGSIPDGISYTQFKDLMCSVEKKDLMVPCILQLMQKWNKTQCQEQDRLLMSARGGQMLSYMDMYCRDPCEQAALQSLVQCFAAVRIDPTSILSQNATIITDKFEFVGTNSDNATAFCNQRERLFNCLSPVATTCPAFVDKLYTVGVDLAGLERATKVQCDDLDTYLETLKCSANFQQCEQQVNLLFQQVQEERYLNGKTKPSEYMSKLCQAKLSKVDCELKKFADSCGAAVTDMVSTFECTAMPLRCRESPETLPVYESLCKKVTTPSPSVPVRPTPPPKQTNPVAKDDIETSRSVDGGAMAVMSLGYAGVLRMLVCALAVMLGVGRGF